MGERRRGLIVVDSSAVIAMVFGEPAADRLARRLADERVGQRVISVANYVEAGTVLAGRQTDATVGPSVLDEFIDLCGIELCLIDAAQARVALDARIRFGRGFGAKAGLNFGDCFAYALAKTLGAPLLYVGDDFTFTDLEAALPVK
jgi:ribonuclease VapC